MVSEIRSGKRFLTILREAPLNLTSLKANIFTANYLHYLRRSYITEAWHPIDLFGTKNCFKTFEEKGDISIHVIKYPGEIIEDLDYSEAGFLACFTFINQEKWVRTFNIKTIACDTTYKITKYNNDLTSFYCLDDHERSISFLFIITDHETTSVLTYCLSKFKENNPDISWDNIKYLMSDLATPFKNAVHTVISPNIIWLFCSWHLAQAVRKKIPIKLNLDNELNKQGLSESGEKNLIRIKTFFYGLRDSLTREEFQKNWTGFSNYLCKNKFTNFHSYFFTNYVKDGRGDHWALYNRIKSRLNTNMVSESRNNDLKNLLDRQTDLRNDNLISFLLIWVKDIQMKLDKSFLSEKTTEFLSSRHKKSESNARKAEYLLLKCPHIARVISYTSIEVSISVNELLLKRCELDKDRDNEMKKGSGEIKRIQETKIISMGIRENKMNFFGDDDVDDMVIYTVKMDGKNFFRKEGFLSSLTAFHALKSNTSKEMNVDYQYSGEENFTLKDIYKSIKVENKIEKFFMTQFSCNCLRFLRSKEICFHIHLAMQTPGVDNSLLRSDSQGDRIFNNSDDLGKNVTDISLSIIWPRENSDTRIVGK